MNLTREEARLLNPDARWLPGDACPVGELVVESGREGRVYTVTGYHRDISRPHACEDCKHPYVKHGLNGWWTLEPTDGEKYVVLLPPQCLRPAPEHSDHPQSTVTP